MVILPPEPDTVATASSLDLAVVAVTTAALSVASAGVAVTVMSLVAPTLIEAVAGVATTAVALTSTGSGTKLFFQILLH